MNSFPKDVYYIKFIKKYLIIPDSKNKKNDEINFISYLYSYLRGISKILKLFKTFDSNFNAKNKNIISFIDKLIAFLN